MGTEPLTVLLVEDDSAHAELVKRGAERHRVATQIYHVLDGEAALNYLFRRGDYADPHKSPRPRVILLDLRLPNVDGLEVLEQIKASEDLRAIPVIVLTTSRTAGDMAGAYRGHANSCVVKPAGAPEFTQFVDDLLSYWGQWNHRPWVSGRSC